MRDGNQTITKNPRLPEPELRPDRGRSFGTGIASDVPAVEYKEKHDRADDSTPEGIPSRPKPLLEHPENTETEQRENKQNEHNAENEQFGGNFGYVDDRHRLTLPDKWYLPNLIIAKKPNIVSPSSLSNCIQSVTNAYRYDRPPAGPDRRFHCPFSRPAGHPRNSARGRTFVHIRLMRTAYIGIVILHHPISRFAGRDSVRWVTQADRLAAVSSGRARPSFSCCIFCSSSFCAPAGSETARI